ncbi:MAG: type III pantothenate kinase [Clostridia bacterium]|nr:type III pantothenate kinase [Clostridia bacterium]
MILCIDIGNTDIAIGGYANDKLQFVTRISTDATKTTQEYESIIVQMLTLKGVKKEDVEGAIISSVVPPLSSVMASVMRELYAVEAIHVSLKIDTGINVVCDDPSSVGADLICACVAARYKHGCPSLIIDMGTATKMMVVNEQGTFIGVSIMAGVMMSMRALSSGTAQLPQFSLDAPERAIGTSTVECMKSGAVFGNAAMIDGMIDRFCEEFGRELPTFATGGYSHAIIPHCKHQIILDPDMVLDGLYIIYNRNK